MKTRREGLTPKQYKYLEWLLDPSINKPTQGEICKTLGVSAVAVCKWKKDSRFIEVYEQAKNELLERPYPEILLRLSERALTDNKATQIYLRHYDKTLDRKSGLVEYGAIKILIGPIEDKDES